MYAVTGATGQLGRKVIAELVRRGAGDQTIALARSLEKAQDLPTQSRMFDYDRPETLSAALGDVDTLLLISGSEVGKRLPQHEAVIEAAKAAGVQRILYTSLLHAGVSGISLAEEHRPSEAAILESGMTYTLLRNGWYTENYTGSIPMALDNGAFVGSAGNGKISGATRDDYAEAAAAAMLGAGHENKTYELAGDDAFTLRELAAEVSRQTGREIGYNDMPKQDYEGVLKSAGLPEPVADMIAGADLEASKGALYDDSHRLSGLIGRKTTPLADAVSAQLNA